LTIPGNKFYLPLTHDLCEDDLKGSQKNGTFSIYANSPDVLIKQKKLKTQGKVALKFVHNRRYT